MSYEDQFVKTWARVRAVSYRYDPDEPSYESFFTAGVNWITYNRGFMSSAPGNGLLRIDRVYLFFDPGPGFITSISNPVLPFSLRIRNFNNQDRDELLGTDVIPPANVTFDNGQIEEIEETAFVYNNFTAGQSIPTTDPEAGYEVSVDKLSAF